MLSAQGFKEVYNLSGGIAAWEGGVAEGPVGLNMEMIRGDETPVEIIELAYGMEKSLGQFYRTAVDRTQDEKVANLLEMLAAIEDKHKERLLELYREIEPAGLSDEQFDGAVSTSIMEGGFQSHEIIEKNERFLQSAPNLLDVAMMLETQALDLYLRFSQKTDNEKTRHVLHRIGDEEKAHLLALGSLREEHA
jgi:rubrerythrin